MDAVDPAAILPVAVPLVAAPLLLAVPRHVVALLRLDEARALPALAPLPPAPAGDPRPLAAAHLPLEDRRPAPPPLAGRVLPNGLLLPRNLPRDA